MIIHRIIVFLMICVGACSACGQSTTCPVYYYTNQFDYVVNSTQITPHGIRVDSTGQNVDLSRIDELTDKVEACVQIVHPSLSCQCLITNFDLPFSSECLTVKIPNDWIWSCDGQWELLPASAPESLCVEKGLSPTLECPCRWRAGIQNQRTIVVTPDLKLYADPLIRILTSCNNPWCKELANCANISVGGI